MSQLEEKIEKMAEACYMQKEQEACRYMNELIPDLMGLIEAAPETEDEPGVLTKSILMNIISQALNAMEQKDYILLADIMKYELLGDPV